ncbi:MAG TPA: class I SAM-dependent methyltransferase [Halanaerobiales bacterium]|nr:class I SAM-dependent methyltransferase [Halanaerobiales bacterium]
MRNNKTSVDFMSVVEFSHDLFRQHIDRGAHLVDATVGNGHDTVFLAKLAGKGGKVTGFDIQSEAINNTKKRIFKEGLEDIVELFQTGHEEMANYVKHKVEGIIFNLGYLPGGNKEIITETEKTTAAVKSGLSLMKEGAIMVLVIYTGHKGGPEEEEALLELAAGLDQEKYNVILYSFLNQLKEPGKVMAIKKRSRGF